MLIESPTQIYCSKCVQPHTRPGITIGDDGLCSACVGNREKIKVIDWDQRRIELELILQRYRGKGPGYDCIVGVSGGKDSTYQAHVLKAEFGMNPLCVTYKTPLRTELGQKNLDNLVSKVGVDLIELTVNPATEKKFILKATKEVGDPAIPEHLGIFSFTLRMAVKMGIPLVVWGENPQLEYGGTKEERQNPYLNKDWLMRHGLLQKRIAQDWIGKDLTPNDMQPFMLPTDEEFASAQICSTFLGHYVRWDPHYNAKIAISLGFQPRKEGPVMGIYDFSDIDCKLITWHHYPKWHKFGMTRTFDNVSVEIREGRMSREEGIKWIIRNRDDLPPNEHLIAITEFLGISENEFMSFFENFRNKKIWKLNSDGRWHIPGYIGGQDVFKI